ncbi:MAG: DUF3110 domain-containing protein [Oscillatoriales cyanobacterium]|jgi:predicted NBD/HSP70 family sugar kinase|nr:MAG: DUF3110 domain-containing protein [Oscillatoriales cyanobacterium]
MRVFVLLFNAGTDNEGIHTIRLVGRDGDEHNIVMMFESAEDAERYAMLLEAQDFHVPTVEELLAEEIEEFCAAANYEAKLIPIGFVPQSEEERIFLSPPVTNTEKTDWSEDPESETGSPTSAEADEDATMVSSELDDIRRRLEGLL